MSKPEPMSFLRAVRARKYRRRIMPGERARARARPVAFDYALNLYEYNPLICNPIIYYGI